jgi:hypothetical protein
MGRGLPHDIKNSRRGDAEIQRLLSTRGVDGVLVVSVTGDTGVQERYAGTI